MHSLFLKHHNIISNELNKIGKIIEHTKYTDYELSINNNKYEELSNEYLQMYNSILCQITNTLQYIKIQNMQYIKYKNTTINQLDNLLIDIDKLSNNINNSKFIIEKSVINNINEIDNINKYKLYDINFINDDDNLDIINDFNYNKYFSSLDDYDILKIPKKKLVNIGFDNYYELPVYNYLSSNIPLNLIVYIKEIKSVVIKVGNKQKFKYINATIGRVPENTMEKNNQRSIICNNNLVKNNKKCINGINCTYYHDPIIGFADIAHFERQYSHNPLIYNCSNFKDGKYIKENVKKINWEEGLNLYQTSFAWILLGLIHSLN